MSSLVRRCLVFATLVTLLLGVLAASAPIAAAAPSGSSHGHSSTRVKGIDVDKTTIPQLEKLMDRHRLTSVDLVRFYLHRIKKLNPELNAVITVSPTALADARAGRQGPPPRRPPTPPRHPGDRQGQHRHDRDADDRGVLGARRQHARATRSSSSGCGPPARSSSPRPTCPSGRTSGRARHRAAGAASAARRTWPTCSTATRAARARAPASPPRPTSRPWPSAPRPTARSSARPGANGIVGIKPTLGLLSRAGIVPISADQDTAGPMTRNVTDAAVAARRDDRHRPSRPGDRRPGRPRAHGLHAVPRQATRSSGARIGVWREGTYDPTISPEIDAIMNDTVAALEAQGATVVDPARIPIEPAYGPEFAALLCEFKDDIASYLETYTAPATRRRSRT